MDQQPPRDDARERLLLAFGALLVIGGVFALGQTLGIYPPFVREALALLSRARWPLAIVAVGVIVIIASARRPAGPHRPVPGTRLYRSRTDRVLSGVLGGLAEYLHADPTLLRLGFVAFALLAGPVAAVIAYVIAAFVIPERTAA
jgi:phage shock protein C